MVRLNETGLYNMMEINANLNDEKHGIKNFDNYVHIIKDVYHAFGLLFGEGIMTKYPLYVDNGYSYAGSAHTIKPVFDEYLHLKTGVTDGEDTAEIIFQVAYNLTHYVFYSIFGLNRQPNNRFNEYSIAMAIAILHTHDIDAGTFYLSALEGSIPSGIEIVKRHNYDFMKIATEILSFKIK